MRVQFNLLVIGLLGMVGCGGGSKEPLREAWQQVVEGCAQSDLVGREEDKLFLGTAITDTYGPGSIFSVFGPGAQKASEIKSIDGRGVSPEFAAGELTRSNAEYTIAGPVSECAGDIQKGKDISFSVEAQNALSKALGGAAGLDIKKNFHLNMGSSKYQWLNLGSLKYKIALAEAGLGGTMIKLLTLEDQIRVGRNSFVVLARGIKLYGITAKLSVSEDIAVKIRANLSPDQLGTTLGLNGSFQGRWISNNQFEAVVSDPFIVAAYFHSFNEKDIADVQDIRSKLRDKPEAAGLSSDGRVDSLDGVVQSLNLSAAELAELDKLGGELMPAN